MTRHLPTTLLLAFLLAPAAADEKAVSYPPTRREPTQEVLHGVAVPDPYRWLEEDDAAEVAAWDDAQDALTRSRLDALPGRDLLAKRIAEEIDLGDMASVPTFRGGRRWFTRQNAGANHAVLYSTDEAGTEEPRIVLDPNLWSEDGTTGMTGWWVSPDGRFVAYARDEKGSEMATLFVREVETGRDLPDRIPRTKFTSVAWSPDSTGFFYDRMPEPGTVPDGEEQYHSRVRHHRLGAPAVDDPIVFGSGRPMLESYAPYSTTDQTRVLVAGGMPYASIDTYEVVEAEGVRLLRPLLVGQDSRTLIDRAGDLWLLNTDWRDGPRGAPRRRLCVARPGETQDPARWRELLPEGPGVIDEAGTVPVGDRVLVHLREAVASRLRVVGLDGKDLGEVRLPGPGSVRDIATKPGDSRVWFTFESYAVPLTHYTCDLSAEGYPLAVGESLPTTIDASRLVSVRETCRSKDGTEIPVFLTYRADHPPDGGAPVVLSGYGGFRVGIYPRFSRRNALWMERGGVWVVANIRGGDEFGEEWHVAGSRGAKENCFDDFVAVADWLVASGRARRERLAIWGGSNGGLLVAACLNRRPDLCRAAICAVPLTDMLRFHRFQYAKMWTEEYGDPDDPEAFGWIRAWSPYHNAPDGVEYPAVLVTAGLHDGRVNAFHARKIAARWQSATRSSRPILLRIDRSSGHGASSTEHWKRELLDELSFLAHELGGLPALP